MYMGSTHSDSRALYLSPSLPLYRVFILRAKHIRATGLQAHTSSLAAKENLSSLVQKACFKSLMAHRTKIFPDAIHNSLPLCCYFALTLQVRGSNAKSYGAQRHLRKALTAIDLLLSGSLVSAKKKSAMRFSAVLQMLRCLPKHVHGSRHSVIQAGKCGSR